MDSQQATPRYVRDGGIEVYPAGEELIAIHLANDEVHRLNLSAAQVLEACDGRSTAEIITHVQQAYPEMPSDRIEQDVMALLPLLVEKGVIRALAAGEDAPPAEHD